MGILVITLYSLFILYMCNAPQFIEVEERTGLGGGFNERGTVEYKERVESDDEYDDFGRKKKKKGGTDTLLGRKPVPMLVEPEVEEEEYEEEEEDDDDADVSKYDLWGDDETAEASKSTTVKEEEVE